MNPLPIECTDPDDRMDGWQVGYFACKNKSMVDASTRKDEGGNAQATLITSTATIKAKEPSYKGYDSPIVNFKDNDCKPYHPDFMPFPYREVKPTVKIDV